MSMNIGSLKANDEGTLVGRIVTLGFNAVVALREVNSSNDRAPAYDMMGLSADRRTWVKIGALWEYTSNETGEAFLSGRIDDPSLEKPLDVAMFRQEDGTLNVSWRRPQRRRAAPSFGSNDALPPMPPAGSDEGADSIGSGSGSGAMSGGDGLGESTAPARGAPAGARRKAPAEAQDTVAA
ncbi:DUF736 domain-containing protein [Novosphingobium gossypii]|uniref:DUF736 domain-containing protein n=1 Tax=Novosphingobium gossypii TaxID=1604774 RepID=UPI003D237C5B